MLQRRRIMRNLLCPWFRKENDRKGKKMRDFSVPYLASKKLLDQYYKAMIAQDRPLAYQIANDLVEMALKLEDVAHLD